MLDLTRRSVGDVTVVSLQGAIDGGDSCRAIHRTFREGLEAGDRKFVVELSGVEWINSLGIGFLVAASIAAGKEGAAIRLVGMSSRVGTALRACGVVPHMWKEVATEDEAIASLA